MTLFRKPTRDLFAVVVGVLVLVIPVAMTQAQSDNIIDSVTEDITQGRSNTDDNSACSKLENVTAPVRIGQQAFKHWVERCGKRSEFGMDRTTIGQTYWQGWSMYLPTSWVNSSESPDIVAQWAAYPPNDKRQFQEQGCGGVGSKMSISGDNLNFHFQHKGETIDTQCDRYSLGNINDMKGKWVDFVMHAKWTGNTDGFLKLWMKVGNGNYVQKVNYTGRTFWNDEERGPYFKMGLYKGRTNWDDPQAPRYLYTDEYRLGNADSSFAEVAPPDAAGGNPDQGQKIRVEAEQMFLSAYRIESPNSAASNSALISLNNATSTTDTASSTFSGSSGKYDVYVGYFDENDGEANLQVNIASARLAAWQLDQNLGSSYAVAQTLVRKKVASGLSINNGARIEIKGTANQAGWARVDYIDFVPVP